MQQGDSKPAPAAELVQVYGLRRTCIAAPSQWEGRAGEHGSICIRYRWGTLRARLTLTDDTGSTSETCIYEEDIGSKTGDRLGGYMTTDEMQKILAGLCRFHGECDEEDWIE